MKRVTIVLDKVTEQIFKKINKLNSYGWPSREFREFLKLKYGTDRKIIRQLISDNQKQIDELYHQNRELAKKINKIK